MAKRKNSGSEARQIPIQDAAESLDEKLDEATDAVTETELEDAVDVADGAENGAEELEVQTDSETDFDASTDKDTSIDAEDLIAEAEAIVEEATDAADAGAPGADADADTPEAALAKAQKDAAEWQDRYLRLHAEWDTYRRRTTEQREEEKIRATEKLVENLLPVLDDFERSIDYADNNGEVGLLEGVRAVQSKLLDVLAKSGLEVLDPAGQAFDALEAQAVGTVPDEEAFEETVHDVYQKGYKMGKKVLRPAMVTVTSGGPKRPKEDDEDAEQEA